MKKLFPSFMSLAAMLYVSLLLSCSSNDEQKPSTGETARYCVYKEMRTCHSTTQGSCPAGGELSDFCPYDGSSVASSSPSSSPSNPTVTSSSSHSSSSIAKNPNAVYGTPVTYGGETYQTVVIGSQTWFQRNLNVAADGSKCYNDSIAYCVTYGKLYNWVTAMVLPDSCERKVCASLVGAKHKGICPSGWHIPSDAEWTTLEDFVGGRSIAGTKLKATSGWKNNGNGEDNFGFSALPGGDDNSGGGSNLVGYFGYWWSSREHSNNTAYYRYMYYNGESVYYSAYGKYSLRSVRCLQD